jgi:hypothetical protein
MRIYDNEFQYGGIKFCFGGWIYIYRENLKQNARSVPRMTETYVNCIGLSYVGNVRTKYST